VKKKLIRLGLISLSFIIFGPFLYVQLFAPDKEHAYTGVHLSELRYQEVSFPNPIANITLAGMLFTPEGEGPFPAAVMIHGSGTSTRDNAWYLTPVKHLYENGIAVLLPDKRGSVKSEGDWRLSSYEDLATDTVAAIDFLTEQDNVRVSYIGIIGMSQGGHLSPVVATQSEDVSFVINVVGTTLTAYRVLRYEENRNLHEMGVIPGLSNVISFFSTYHLRTVRQKDFWDAVGNFDPAPYWRRLSVPALVLYGEDDRNVPARRSARRIDSFENDLIQVQIFEGSGHSLNDPRGEGHSIFRQDALNVMKAFILAVKPER
jgi:dienelactone hydrolase